MKGIIFLFFSTLTLATTTPSPPFPIFLKSGFSSVLEFEDTPTRVVLGDTSSFQVEKLDHSLVIKTLNAYASTNMFVYFKTDPARIFVLTASEDAEPTYYKKFESIKIPMKSPGESSSTNLPKTFFSSRVISTRFDSKKDYLTIEAEVVGNSSETLKPNWDLVRIKMNGLAMSPFKLWAERKDIQIDSRVKTRFIFRKPHVPRDLKGVFLVIPLQGKLTAIKLALRRSGK